MRKLFCSITAPLLELLPATAGDVLATFYQVTVLLGSPPQTGDMYFNNLSYLLGGRLFDYLWIHNTVREQVPNFIMVINYYIFTCL